MAEVLKNVFLKYGIMLLKVGLNEYQTKWKLNFLAANTQAYLAVALVSRKYFITLTISNF
jgi:hypothetical protein